MESEYLDFIWAGICAVFVWFFGRADGLIIALVSFTCMDYVTGVIAAGIKHELSSRIGFKGIAKKLIIFILVGVAHIVEQVLGTIAPQFLGQSEILRDAVILFYCANEGLSILENADALGIPFPQKLRDMFLSMKNKDNEKQKTKDKK